MGSILEHNKPPDKFFDGHSERLIKEIYRAYAVDYKIAKDIVDKFVDSMWKKHGDIHLGLYFRGVRSPEKSRVEEQIKRMAHRMNLEHRTDWPTPNGKYTDN